MAEVDGFLKYPRKSHSYRPKEERLKDWKEVEVLPSLETVQEQAKRCMDCGVPFCLTHHGCPLGNLIPEWNKHLGSGDLASAWQALEETNNFPEITGRLCPAPCESACVAGKDGDPVAIRSIEQTLADQAFSHGWVLPRPPQQKFNLSVAIIGSGPAGLAAGQELNRLGYQVTIFEKASRPGGLLRFGIPDFKYEKSRLDQRISQLESEGVIFRCGVEIGKDLSISQLQEKFSFVGLALGAEQARDLPLPGRHLKGIHLAMDYLVPQNLHLIDRPQAQGKNVIVIGGGDTGSDCVGTALRQGAKSVVQLEVLPRPPRSRSSRTPWPQWPMKLRATHAHDEGGERQWSVLTQQFIGDEQGSVRSLQVTNAKTDGSGASVGQESFQLPAELVIVAVGFTGPRREGILSQLNIQLDSHDRPITNSLYQTSNPNVFAAGDVRRGQSLIVWAIKEGRSMAHAIHEYASTKNFELIECDR